MGRPTKYNPEWNDKVEKFCKLGCTDEQLADFLDVAVSTINKWKLDYPEFSESIKRGKDLADALVADSLYNRALGYSHPDTKFATHEGLITDSQEFIKHYPPDSTAAIFWLKNRRKEHWRDRKEVDLGEDTTKALRGITDALSQAEAAEIYKESIKSNSKELQH